MSEVLTIAATMTCPHKPGTLKVTASDALTVGGQSVFAGSELSATTAVVGGCPGVSASGIKPCTTATALSGLAAALTVGGNPVVLAATMLQTDNAVPVTIVASSAVLTAS